MAITFLSPTAASTLSGSRLDRASRSSGVTITALAEGRGRSVVGASWVHDGHGHSDTVEVDSYEQARAIAHQVADQLAAGIPPDLTRD